MPERVNPSCYIIAQTALTDVESYLISIGSPDWRPDDQVSDSENLIEFAGRICYRSWEPHNESKPDATNPNVVKVRKGNAPYIGHVLSVGHGCYDRETEVLTAQGWKFWPEVTDEDVFATLNKSTHVVEWHSPKRIVRYNHKGRMYRVDAQGVDLLVTPDHKMYACKMTTKQGRKKVNYDLIPAYELDETSHAYYKSSEPSKSIATPEQLVLAELLGFAIGDGHYDGYKLRFHLHRERKINYLLDLCKRGGFDLKASNSEARFDIGLDSIAMHAMFHSMYDNEGEKIIPVTLGETPSCILEAIYTGMMNSDGCVVGTSDVYDTTSKRLANQFQILCLLIGKATNISQADCYDRGGNRKQMYRSTIQTFLKPEVNKWTGSESRAYFVDGFDDEVFCCEVPNNTVYVRRNGKPVWSGNSILEHASITFVAKDVSRIFTHEQVRHRAGFAYSQESLRFVRLTQLRYYLPECFAKDPWAAKYFHDKFEEMERWQQELTDHFSAELGPDAPFNRKKELTSAFRRLAPEGLATSIVFTANLRALRHVIRMRTSPGAEEEIRVFYDEVARMVKEAFPNVFQDMERLDDGEWAMKYGSI